MALCFVMTKLVVLAAILVNLCIQDTEGRIRIRIRIRIRVRIGAVGIQQQSIGNQAPSACKILLSRADWGSNPVEAAGDSQPPPPLYDSVTIYDTGAQTCLSNNQHCVDLRCTDEESCTKLLILMQDYDKKNGFGDIRYNFLVGQDGQIYEGRGWDKVAEMDDPIRKIGIVFIGDFTTAEPNQASVDAVHTFLECAVVGKKLNAAASLDVQQDTPLYEAFKSWRYKF